MYVHEFGFSIHLCTQLAHVLEEPVEMLQEEVGCVCGEEKRERWDADAVRKSGGGGMRVR